MFIQPEIMFLTTPGLVFWIEFCHFLVIFNASKLWPKSAEKYSQHCRTSTSQNCQNGHSNPGVTVTIFTATIVIVSGDVCKSNSNLETNLPSRVNSLLYVAHACAPYVIPDTGQVSGGGGRGEGGRRAPG